MAVLTARALPPIAVLRPPVAGLARAFTPSAVLVVPPVVAPSEQVTTPVAALPTMN